MGRHFGLSAASRANKFCRWRIIRLGPTPAELIGYVEAPDEATAIAEAIECYEITESDYQRQLVAQRLR